MTGTDLELKTVHLQKKREGQHFERAEFNRLCRAIWRKRRALKRRKHLTKIKKRAGIRKAPKKTQRKHFSWSSTAKEENLETVLTSFFQDLYSTPLDQLDQADRIRWIELRKNLRVDCAGRTLISTEKLEKVLSKLGIRKRITGPDQSGCLEGIAPGCLGNLAKSLSVMC